MGGWEELNSFSKTKIKKSKVKNIVNLKTIIINRTKVLESRWIKNIKIKNGLRLRDP